MLEIHKNEEKQIPQLQEDYQRLGVSQQQTAIIGPQYSKHRSQSAYEDYVHHKIPSPNCILHRYFGNKQRFPNVSVYLNLLNAMDSTDFEPHGKHYTVHLNGLIRCLLSAKSHEHFTVLNYLLAD